MIINPLPNNFDELLRLPVGSAVFHVDHKPSWMFRDWSVSAAPVPLSLASKIIHCVIDRSFDCHYAWLLSTGRSYIVMITARQNQSCIYTIQL